MMNTVKTMGFLLLGIVMIVSAFFLINDFESGNLHNQSYAVEPKLGNELQPMGLYSGLFEGFTLENKFFDEAGQSTKISYRRNDEVLKISSLDNIDKSSADILIEDEIQTIYALYSNALSPYPGEISNEIACHERFKPEFYTKQTAWLDYSYFILFATNRFTYGACSEDLVKYRSILAWAYCSKKNAFYRLEFFVPIESFSESHLDMIASFRC